MDGIPTILGTVVPQIRSPVSHKLIGLECHLYHSTRLVWTCDKNKCLLSISESLHKKCLCQGFMVSLFRSRVTEGQQCYSLIRYTPATRGRNRFGDAKPSELISWLAPGVNQRALLSVFQVCCQSVMYAVSQLCYSYSCMLSVGFVCCQPALLFVSMCAVSRLCMLLAAVRYPFGNPCTATKPDCEG